MHRLLFLMRLHGSRCDILSVTCDLVDNVPEALPNIRGLLPPRVTVFILFFKLHRLLGKKLAGVSRIFQL